MKDKYLYISLCFSQFISPSMERTEKENIPFGIETRVISMDRSNSSSISDSEDEELCKTAIGNFYPDRFKSKSFYVKPYLKKLLQNAKRSPRREEASLLEGLRRVKSEDTQAAFSP